MIDSLTKAVEEKFKNHKDRFKHVLGVAATAARLAKRYNVSEDKAYMAAIFHDYAKYDTIAVQTKYIDPKLVKKYKETPVIYHALAAANMIEAFGITDLEIKSAISKHVWGNVEMNMLDKIILISDKIEPNRTYDTVEHFRQLADSNIDQAIYEFLLENVEFNKQNNNKIADDQYAVINKFKELLHEQN